MRASYFVNKLGIFFCFLFFVHSVLCRKTETFIERLTKVAGFLLELIHILRSSEKSANV